MTDVRARTPDGRIAAHPATATPEARANLLLRFRAAGIGVRPFAEQLAADGVAIGKSALAQALAAARDEEAAVQARSREERRAQAQAQVSEPEPRPGARVLTGLYTAPGVGDLMLLQRRADSSDAQTAVRASRELERLTAQANMHAGLSPSGMASVSTPSGTYNYDPSDPSDVSRLRGLIRDELGDEVADAWQPHPGLR